jgi:hypothetical protein
MRNVPRTILHQFHQSEKMVTLTSAAHPRNIRWSPRLALPLDDGTAETKRGQSPSIAVRDAICSWESLIEKPLWGRKAQYLDRLIRLPETKLGTEMSGRKSWKPRTRVIRVRQLRNIWSIQNTLTRLHPPLRMKTPKRATKFDSQAKMPRLKDAKRPGEKTGKALPGEEAYI